MVSNGIHEKTVTSVADFLSQKKRGSARRLPLSSDYLRFSVSRGEVLLRRLIHITHYSIIYVI